MKFIYIKDYIFYPICLWIYNWFQKLITTNIEVYSENTSYSLVKAHASDACYDIQSSKSYEIFPGQSVTVETGLYFKLPSKWEAQVRSRSGLANNHGVMVLNSPGTIDSNYRGPIKVILHNTGVNTFKIQPGDRIAQVKFDRVPRVSVKCSNNNFSMNTDRGQKGFGSSGK